MRKQKTSQKADLKKITSNSCSNEITPDIAKKCKEAGFKGKPVVAVKYVNKLHPPTGNKDHDIDAGNIAYIIDGKLIKSPAIGDNYFRVNFVKAE